MFRNTRFREVLKGISRGTVDRLTKKHQANKHCKGFAVWDHLVVMLYAQFSQCSSLRELETGFNHQAVHHYHLRTRCVKRSTLSDANTKRDSEVFMDICQSLMSSVSRKFQSKINDGLQLLDSTSITLKGRGYDAWTAENSTRNTQGIKVHLLFSPDEAVVKYFNMTPANINDVTDAKSMTIEESKTYVFDKGYCDYNWWAEMNAKGAKFVTRYKNNASLKRVKDNAIPKEAKGVILEDSLVVFKNKHSRSKHKNKYGTPLRKVVVARPDHKNKKPLVLATNDLVRSALEIADCYKARWQIELFFKWIKQNLKIKKFLGRSENAVRIQIITAIIGYLLVALYRDAHQVKESMKNTLILIGTSLFQSPVIDNHMLKKRQKEERKKAREKMKDKQGMLF